MRYTLVVAGCFVACTLLAPVMWTLWIDQGSANSNFYFAITLVYNSAQVMDMLKRLAYAMSGACRCSS
jgi:phosphatidylinositol glycan class U